ncbi:hypothetical protein AB5N19_00057 [Seiridium cardinale]
MIELVLESGSGPTVTQALTCGNPALLSIVIQLSFLAWSHEHQSLSQALTQAIDDVLVESRTATSHKLNYVSLLGTVGACQQQTTGFSWAHHYAAIEDKIFKELKNSSSRERPAKRRKSRSGQAITHVHQQSASDRSLPYVILRGLVKSLDSIQRFPEDCIPQLSCDRGISSVVLWCYHILGISVLIRLSDAYWVPWARRIYRRPKLRLGSYRTSMRREIDKFLTWPAAAKFEDNTNFTYAVKHPEDECNASRIPERIFRCQDTWYFYVTGDGAARWLGLDNLDRLSLEGNDYPMVARGKG